MLNSSARQRDMFRIHPVDSVDMTHPGSLASQHRRKQERQKWSPITLGNSAKFENDIGVGAWDSTSKQMNSGLWRPPERHHIL